MTDHKFTDDEVIKALECCAEKGCTNCPLKSELKCHRKLMKNVHALFNRQKAELDDLKRDDLPRCKDALRRANEIGMAVDKENQELRAEIERLTAERDEARQDCAVAERNHQLAVAEREANVKGFTENLKTAKAEAIKEFAKRLKVKVGSIPQYHFNLLQVEDDINALVKEMTERTK